MKTAFAEDVAHSRVCAALYRREMVHAVLDRGHRSTTHINERLRRKSRQNIQPTVERPDQCCVDFHVLEERGRGGEW